MTIMHERTPNRVLGALAILVAACGSPQSASSPEPAQELAPSFTAMVMAQRAAAPDEEVIVTPGTTLHAGDGVRVLVQSDRDAYLTVVLVDTAGKALALVPNAELGTTARLPADVSVQVPSRLSRVRTVHGCLAPAPAPGPGQPLPLPLHRRGRLVRYPSAAAV